MAYLNWEFVLEFCELQIDGSILQKYWFQENIIQLC